jgi:hypothetical protein
LSRYCGLNLMILFQSFVFHLPEFLWTDNSTNWFPGWQPFHTNLLVFSSQTENKTISVNRNACQQRRMMVIYNVMLHRHLWADCPENVGALTSHNPMGLHSLLACYRDSSTFFTILPANEIKINKPLSVFAYYSTYTTDTRPTISICRHLD